MIEPEIPFAEKNSHLEKRMPEKALKDFKYYA